MVVVSSRVDGNGHGGSSTLLQIDQLLGEKESHRGWF